jgi:hypothetical protein
MRMCLFPVVVTSLEQVVVTLLESWLMGNELATSCSRLCHVRQVTCRRYQTVGQTCCESVGLITQDDNNFFQTCQQLRTNTANSSCWQAVSVRFYFFVDCEILFFRLYFKGKTNLGNAVKTSSRNSWCINDVIRRTVVLKKSGGPEPPPPVATPVAQWLWSLWWTIMPIQEPSTIASFPQYMYVALFYNLAVYTYLRRRSIFVSFEQVPFVNPRDFSSVCCAPRYLPRV